MAPPGTLSAATAAAPPDGSSEVLFVTFNQDYSCVALGTTSGIQIYSLTSHTCIYSYQIGSVRSVSMLFCTSLLAYVGSGMQPALTPRKLTVLNTAASTPIQDISFQTVVLSVLMNKSRLVAVLERQACVYALQSLQHLYSIDTPRNLQAACALSACDLPCLMALPAGTSGGGTVRIYNLLHGTDLDTGQPESGPTPTAFPLPQPTAAAAAATEPASSCVLCELSAHSSPLAIMSWNHDATLLATASTKGTVIRVHRLPPAVCVAAFRRGTVPATVESMCWSPPHVQPPLIAVASSRGSVHIFRLDEESSSAGDGSSRSRGLKATGGATGIAYGLLSAVMRLAPVPKVVGPLPSIVTIHLPADGGPAAVGLLPRPVLAQTANTVQLQGATAGLITVTAGSDKAREGQATQGRGTEEGRVGEASVPQGGGDQEGQQDDAAAYDADSVTLVVATLNGVLYEYAVTRLHALHGQEAACSLENEWPLKGANVAVAAEQAVLAAT